MRQMESLVSGQGKLHRVKFNNRWHATTFVYFKNAFNHKILNEVRVQKSRTLHVGRFLKHSGAILFSFINPLFSTVTI